MSKVTRIKRKEKLVASDEILLPVGIFPPGENKRYRNVIIDDMTGVDEHNMAKKKIRRNGAKAISILLRRSIQEIEGLLPRKSNPNSLIEADLVTKYMTQIDRDFLLCAILVLGGEEQTEVRGRCLDCEETLYESVTYSQLEVYDWPEEAPLEIQDTLPRGYMENGTIHKDFTLVFPTGSVQELAMQQGGKNSAKAMSHLYAACITQLGSLDGIDSDMATRLKSRDRRYIGKLFTSKFPGIQLVRNLTCEECDKTYERTVDLTGFFGDLIQKQSKD